jgi:hypothetical protein
MLIMPLRHQRHDQHEQHAVAADTTQACCSVARRRGGVASST